MSFTLSMYSHAMRFTCPLMCKVFSLEIDLTEWFCKSQKGKQNWCQLTGGINAVLGVRGCHGYAYIGHILKEKDFKINVLCSSFKSRDFVFALYGIVGADWLPAETPHVCGKHSPCLRGGLPLSARAASLLRLPRARGQTWSPGLLAVFSCSNTWAVKEETLAKKGVRVNLNCPVRKSHFFLWYYYWNGVDIKATVYQMSPYQRNSVKRNCPCL